MVLHLSSIYTVVRAIRVPEWDEETRSRTITFWTQRGMHFFETGTNVLRARRGRLLHNVYSFDNSKLKADLTLTVADLPIVDCVMHIDTSFQDWTDWNRAYFHLEMVTFETFLLRDDKQEKLWQCFKKDSNLATTRWFISAMFFGRRMSRAEWAKYTNLPSDSSEG
ncbi:MAG TPA: hypothetical protein V6D17_18580 [Candidatus Obscuribacterales bacterium]